MDPDGRFPDILVTSSHMSNDLGLHLFSRISSLLSNSIYHANILCVPRSMALQEAFSSLSKFAGALFVWCSTGSAFRSPRSSYGSKPGNGLSGAQVGHATSCQQNLIGPRFAHGSKLDSVNQFIFAEVLASTTTHLWKELGQLQPFPVLSLSAALVLPFDNSSPKVLAVPLEGSNEQQINGYLDHAPCEDGCQGCPSIYLSNINWIRDSVEPKTGIKFPSFLSNPLVGEENLHRITEILVGTGSKSLRIVRVKSIQLYAFGIYVHVNSICKKLGRKYGSVPADKLKDRPDFLEDLLREDINMTLRLVVSCNGIKLNAVKEAFEKSLRIRLQKMNPETDFHCLSAFGSYFNQNIPLPVGTTIDFRKTADGHLITEIGGSHIGSVCSKDLCRAFFDMYIGESPVSVEARQDLAQNIAGLIRRC